jgi:hypothetical protein
MQQTLWPVGSLRAAYDLSLTGQKARAELALYDCQKGNYDAGIQELERLLHRGRFPVPDQ